MAKAILWSVRFLGSSGLSGELEKILVPLKDDGRQNR